MRPELPRPVACANPVATAVCSLGFGEQLQKENSEANPLAVGGDDRMSKKLSAHWDRNAGQARGFCRRFYCCAEPFCRVF